MRFMKKARLMISVAMVLLAHLAHAQEMQRLKNDPKRPVGLISRDLGISAEQFVACFNDVHPAPSGTHPRGADVHDNKAHLLPCLQKANPSITNQSLDAVMDRYRPGGYEAQRPEDQ
jgi:hypothetical protein